MLYTRNLKQTLNYGLVFKKVHILSKFNQSPWLKSYIDMNTDLRKKATLYTTFFTENLLAKDMKKIKNKKKMWILMNKSVYLGLSIPESSKILMCEF